MVEDTLASVEAVVRTQDKQGFRLLDKPKSFYFHDKSSGDILTFNSRILISYLNSGLNSGQAGL